jgi:transposase
MEVLAPTQEKSREDELLVIIEDLKAALAQRDETIRCAELKLDVLQQMLFGRRSERLATDDKDLQRRLFNEAESEAPTEGDQPTDEGVQAATTKKKKHPGSGRRRPAGSLERVEIFHDLDHEESACPWCNSARPKIGEERTEEIEVIPAKVIVKVHVRAKHGPCDCDDFTGHDEKAVITAPGPARIAPGSLFSNNTAAFIIVNKFTDGLPFHRQESVLGRMGLDMARGTMARLAIRVSNELEPLFNRMLRDVRGSPVLGMDETVLQVLKELGRKPSSESRMWVARGFAGDGTQGPVIWFEYADSRSGDVAASIISDFKGHLQTDGYAGYTRLGRRLGVEHVGCWAHVRREFHQLYRSDEKSPLARQILHLIGRLYTIERSLRALFDNGTLNIEDFMAQRKAETQPVFEAILDWLHKHEPEVPPQSPMGKAISYALGQYRRAIRYVEHWLLTPDNNPVENAIRPFVIGRKNWLFNDTPRGAKASARLYSLIETAKANGHEPFKYLCHLFATLPLATDKHAAAASLLPYNLKPGSY